MARPRTLKGHGFFKATEHPYYSGEFHLTGGRATLVGSVRDTSPWDHLDYAGKHLIPVRGTIEIDVSDLANTGRVMAEFAETAAQYRVVFDRFEGAAPYQDGGIATRVYEHGDSNHGDPLYPKTWLYLGGWGKVRWTRGQEFGLYIEKLRLNEARRLETYIRNKIS